MSSLDRTQVVDKPYNFSQDLCDFVRILEVQVYSPPNLAPLLCLPTKPLEISGACILLSRLAADGDAAVAALLLVETEVDMLELLVAQLEASDFFFAQKGGRWPLPRGG